MRPPRKLALPVSAALPWLLCAPLAAAQHTGPAPGGGVGVVIGFTVDPLSCRAVVFDTARDHVLGAVDAPPGTTWADVVVLADRSFAYLTDAQNQVWVIDLRGAPALASGTNPIPIQATGADLALTPDQRFLIVTGPGGAGNRPTSVVDVANRREASSTQLGSDYAVEVCADGIVLIAEEFVGIYPRRITSAGQLVPAGVNLRVNAFNLACPRRGATAVAVTDFPVLTSFRAGLTPIQSISLEPAFGNPVSAVFDAAGRRIFVRQNGRPGTVQALSYSQGAFGSPALWFFSLEDVGGFAGVETLAVDDVQGKVYAPTQGGVLVLSMDEGKLLTTITHPGLARAIGVDVVDALGR